MIMMMIACEEAPKGRGPVSLLARYDDKDGDVDDDNELTQQDGRKKRTVKR